LGAEGLCFGFSDKNGRNTKIPEENTQEMVKHYTTKTKFLEIVPTQRAALARNGFQYQPESARFEVAQ
jgi:hypothetical protein